MHGLGARWLRATARRIREVSYLAVHRAWCGRHLVRLRDAYRGGRCFVLGNGPSLSAHDLTKEKKFATNMFIPHPQLNEVAVNFFCVSDPLFWQVRGALLEAMRSAFRGMKGCRLFVEARSVRACKRLLGKGDVYSLYLDTRHAVYDGYFSVDVSRCVNWGGGGGGLLFTVGILFWFQGGLSFGMRL